MNSNQNTNVGLIYNPYSEAATPSKDTNILNNPITVVVASLLFSALDFAVLYPLIDHIGLNSVLMGIITTISICLILDVLPIIMSPNLHGALDHTKKNALGVFIIQASIWLLVFLATVIVRFKNVDFYMDQNSNKNIVNEVGDESGMSDYDYDEEKSKSYAAVVLLAILPAATSILLLFWGFTAKSLNPTLKRKGELEKLIEALEKELAYSQAQLESIPDDEDYQLAVNSDTAAYEAAVKKIQGKSALLKTKARVFLSQMLANPDAISILSHELDDKFKDNDGGYEYEES